MTASDASGVHVPPPILFLACFGAALALDAIVPLPPPGNIVVPLGGFFLVAGLIPLFWALLRFLRARVSPLPNRPVDTLVIAGPYRFTRNPMYLGMLLLYAGAALLMRLTWALLLAPLVVYLLNRLVIAREEAYLTRRFGQDYLAYRGRVRRWI